MRTRPLLTVAAMVAVAACGLSGPDWMLSFSVLNQDLLVDEEYVHVSGASRQIIVEAGVAGPNPCTPPTRAEVQKNGSSLLLTVNSMWDLPPGWDCANVLVRSHYRAVLGNFPAGSYDLQVRHTWEGTGLADTTVFDGTVLVE
jgi:hypothetical protein